MLSKTNTHIYIVLISWNVQSWRGCHWGSKVTLGSILLKQLKLDLESAHRFSFSTLDGSVNSATLIATILPVARQVAVRVTLTGSQCLVQSDIHRVLVTGHLNFEVIADGFAGCGVDALIGQFDHHNGQAFT